MGEERPTVIAILGTGSIGEAHLRTLSRTEGVRALAVPVRHARLAEWAAAGFNVAADLQDAAQQGATLGIIATDTGRHVTDGLTALEAGWHLLIEKPLARNAREAVQLVRRAGEAGRRVYVGCPLRFSASLRTFRETLPRIGRVHAVRIECQSYLPDWRPARTYRDSYSARAEEGGVLRDLVHEIDYAGWLFGWPGSVQAKLRNLGRLGIEAEEIAELTWEASSDCLVSVSLDYLSRPPRRRMRISGTNGVLEWDGVAGTVTLDRPEAQTEIIQVPQTQEQMLLEQDLAFLRACTGGSSGDLATGEEGARALAVCDAARRSSASGREERVADETMGSRREAQVAV